MRCCDVIHKCRFYIHYIILPLLLFVQENIAHLLAPALGNYQAENIMLWSKIGGCRTLCAVCTLVALWVSLRRALLCEQKFGPDIIVFGWSRQNLYNKCRLMGKSRAVIFCNYHSAFSERCSPQFAKP